MAAAGPLPVAAASANACVLGVPAPVAWTWSRCAEVSAVPAAAVPTAAGAVPSWTDLTDQDDSPLTTPRTFRMFAAGAGVAGFAAGLRNGAPARNPPAPPH